MKLMLPLALLVAIYAGAAEGFVVVCPINGAVDDGTRVFVERAVKEAVGAEALIFEIDTPGGRIDSAILISNAIIGCRTHTIAFIKGMGAISAGALISYSCDDIIMTAEANIGAATPVLATAEGMMPTGEKEVSFMRGKMRALAERKNRNPALAEAMVDKDIELHAYTDAQGKLQIYAVYKGGSLEPPPAPKNSSSTNPAEVDPAEVVRRVFDMSLDEGRLRAQVTGGNAGAPAPAAGPRPEGEIILPAGKLLTLTAQEALHYALIPAVVQNLDGALAQYKLSGAEIRRLDMSVGEHIFRFLTTPVVAGLLLMLGIGGIYLEIKTPGFGAPGIVGIICLVLFFGSHLVLGIADWFDVILVVGGLGLIAIEVFILPGFGVVGAAGILCLLVGLYLTLTTAPIPEFSWEYERMADAMKSLLIATLTLGLLIYATWRYLPGTALHSRLVLTHTQLQDKGYVVQSEEDESGLLGKEGVAISMLRPAGRGRFGSKTIQVVSRSEYIPAGTPIVIVQIDGNRYVVDPLEGKK